MDKKDPNVEKERTRVAQDDVAGKLTARDKSVKNNAQVKHANNSASDQSKKVSQVTAGGADKPGLSESD